MQQVVVRTTDLFAPEGHDLHQSKRASDRHRVPVEIALNLNDGQDEFGGQLHAIGFVVYARQECDAFLRILDLSFEPAGHVSEPHLGVESIRETGGIRDGGEQCLA